LLDKAPAVSDDLDPCVYKTSQERLSNTKLSAFVNSGKERTRAGYFREIGKGKGTCAYLSLDEEGRPLGEQIILSLEQGSVIQIKPFTAHALQLDFGSMMLCYSSIPFDPDDPDMFMHELEL